MVGLATFVSMVWASSHNISPSRSAILVAISPELGSRSSSDPARARIPPGSDPARARIPPELGSRPSSDPARARIPPEIGSRPSLDPTRARILPELGSRQGPVSNPAKARIPPGDPR